MIKLKSILLREDITDTPEFKRWFGNSKVVDKSGKPLIVYHGTTKDFSEFDRTKGRMWFTTSTKVASTYALHNSPTQTGGHVKPLYVSIQNPFIVGSSREEMMKWVKTNDQTLADAGFDGVIFDKNTHMNGYVFRNNQIKSAIGNCGEFDPHDPDITKEYAKFS